MFDMGAYGSGARFLLETAVKKRNIELAAWVLAHGANPNAAPARDRRFPKRSLYELALMEDCPTWRISWRVMAPRAPFLRSTNTSASSRRVFGSTR